MSEPKRYSFLGYGVECEHNEGDFVKYTYCQALEQDNERLHDDKQELRNACEQKQEIINSNKCLVEDFIKLEQDNEEYKATAQLNEDIIRQAGVDLKLLKEQAAANKDFIEQYRQELKNIIKENIYLEQMNDGLDKIIGFNGEEFKILRGALESANKLNERYKKALEFYEAWAPTVFPDKGKIAGEALHPEHTQTGESDD